MLRESNWFRLKDRFWTNFPLKNMFVIWQTRVILKIIQTERTCSHDLYFSSDAGTTDTRRLNLTFFAAQIQILLPNKYLGFGYKSLVFCRNNGWLLESMDKESHSAKMGADSLVEKNSNAPKCSCPICLPKPKSLRYCWKKA